MAEYYAGAAVGAGVEVEAGTGVGVGAGVEAGAGGTAAPVAEGLVIGRRPACALVAGRSLTSSQPGTKLTVFTVTVRGRPGV